MYTLLLYAEYTAKATTPQSTNINATILNIIFFLFLNLHTPLSYCRREISFQIIKIDNLDYTPYN